MRGRRRIANAAALRFRSRYSTIRQRSRALLALGAVALLAGCTPGTELVTQTSEDGHVLLAQARDTGAYPDALVEGTLSIVGTCFALETDHGTYATVFPPGSSVVEGTEQVAIPHWGTLSLGDELSGGGGYDSDYAALGEIPLGCRTDEIAVVNPFT
jgi:hypothetical protein